MSERVHKYLDGELSREELSSREQQEAVAVLDAIERVGTHLKSVGAPDLTLRIMDALPGDLYSPRPAAKATPLGWLWRPRPISFTYRPAFGFGLMAAAAMAFLLVTSQQTPPQPPATVTTAAAPEAHMYVQFRLEAPEASDVRLAGSFTGWQPTVQLSETAPGVWSAMVPLDPGVHDYTFLVDGEQWVVDPNATNVEDSFGGMNSRLFLAAPLDAA